MDRYRRFRSLAVAAVALAAAGNTSPPAASTPGGGSFVDWPRASKLPCTAAEKLKLRSDFNEFHVASVQDSLYNSSGSSGALNRTATTNHVGSELNGAALHRWSKIWRFGAGCGHLFAGGYLKQSKGGFGCTYPYLMFAGSF